MDFISPIVSAMIAAESLRHPAIKTLRYGPTAAGYMSLNGLRDTIDGNYRRPVRGGLQGRTYSQLTRLVTPQDVDFCNEIVGDLLYFQLGNNGQAARMLAQIVGELHDNVASHADGAGFSSCQVYKQSNQKTRIEYGIADIGHGFLYNAKRAEASISTDFEAIEWAVKKGTTSARTGEWSQRLPDDALYSPFPDSTDTSRSENHHLGLGLYELRKVVRQLGGQLWICSGDGTVRISKGQVAVGGASVAWMGVAIEFEVFVSDDGSIPEHSERHPSLREKLKL